MERGQLTEYELKLRKSIAYNIKTLLKKKNMTQKELSSITKIPTSTLSDYLNAKSLAVPGNVQKIADALGVSKSEIDPSFGPSLEAVGDTISLPIIGRISCGNGSVAFEDIEGYQTIPSEWASGEDHFFLRAKGDSMTGARIYDGDLLLIRKQPTVENGEIAAVVINGEDAVLKRVYQNGDQVILQSENPNFPPIFTKIDDVIIVGKLKMNVIKF